MGYQSALRGSLIAKKKLGAIDGARIEAMEWVGAVLNICLT